MKSTDQLLKRRKDFPSLTRKLNGTPLAYFDGPAGSQVPKHVIDAIGSYYKRSNANACGTFVTSVDTDKMVQDARSAVATFLGATDNCTISFGANMTTLNFSLSKAIARALKKGGEIVITQLDHEANRGPWLALQDKKTVVNEVRLRSDGTLDYDDFEKKINKRTRLVAMGLASNALAPSMMYVVSVNGRVLLARGFLLMPFTMHLIFQSMSHPWMLIFSYVRPISSTGRTSAFFTHGRVCSTNSRRIVSGCRTGMRLTELKPAR
jgi:hypothetical protein